MTPSQQNPNVTLSADGNGWWEHYSRNERKVIPVAVGGRAVIPGGWRQEERERWGKEGGVQEEKAWEEKILTDHTEAAGSTSEAQLVCARSPRGSLWCAV